MDEQGTSAVGDRPVSACIFVSYATADRKDALSICAAIERRGSRCWISCRDVAPGENYQEEIVRSIRTARAMVLVFSDAANNSDEIKKELSLASRYHIPVMALRIEDVEPSDAFAYELSTRQWIDAFAGWDRPIDALVRHLNQTPGAPLAAPMTTPPHGSRARPAHRPAIFAAAGLALVGAVGATWWLLRPAPAAAHSMMVRLTSFQRLSPDLPANLPDTVRDEVIAAFGDQGVVGVSTASAPASGPAPAYALGGTIRREGNQIRVITRLTNERTGTSLWSDSVNYDASDGARVPRRIAIHAGTMVRCGLFAASTYPKALPDPVLAEYMKYCWNSGIYPNDPGKGLQSARKVAAGAPDFSWGWSAIVVAAAQQLYINGSGPLRDEARQLGLQAADRALLLDPGNSEALAQKSILIDPPDYVAQEQMLRRAIAARPLDCGCEHIAYGVMLQNVGRYADSVPQFRHATEMLALDSSSQYLLADTLTAIGKPAEGKPHFDAGFELDANPITADLTAVTEATETGDYAAAIKALHNPKLPLPEKQKAALLAGMSAMISRDAGAKARAVQRFAALPNDQKDYLAIKMFAALGDSHDALVLFTKRINSRPDWPSLLWYPSMRGVLSDPAFPPIAHQLGLVRYWKATRSKPDVCSTSQAPPFCRMI